MATPEPGRATAATGPEGNEAQQAPEETQKSAEDPKKGDTQAPVACVAGVPRGPVSIGELARVTPPGNGGRTPPETLEEINQQYLKSKYKFKEEHRSKAISSKWFRISEKRARSRRCLRG